MTIEVVVGNEAMVAPFAAIANFNAVSGTLVAGSTGLIVDGCLYVETHVGFLWDRIEGATPFDIDCDVYWSGVDHFNSAIADVGIVVGSEIAFDVFSSRAYTFSRADGLQYLQMPVGAITTSATLISSDGRLIYGTASPDPFERPRGAFWVDRQPYYLQIPGHGGSWYSQTNDISEDGRTAVGSLWREGRTRAARWRWGGMLPLPGFDAFVPENSSASFICEDSAQVVGTATVVGITGIARWDATGARFFPPPPEATVESLGDATPDCTTVVGALSVGGNHAPFVWTEAGGYAVIDEFERADDYDLSAATHVTDDGEIVGGNVASTVVIDGDPPRLAFLWTATAGTVAIDDLLAPYIDDSSFYHLVALSAHGRQLLLEGNIRDPEYNSGDPNVSPNVLVTFSASPMDR